MKRLLANLKVQVGRKMNRLFDRIWSLGPSAGLSFVQKRYFDSVDYLNRVAEAREYKGSAFQHFVKVGLRNGQKGRFFDPQFYYSEYPDIATSTYDAQSHFFSETADSERRFGRFFEIRSVLGRRSIQNYQLWVKLFDQHGCPEFESIRGECLKRPVKDNIAFACNLSGGALNWQQIELLIKSIASQYYVSGFLFLLVDELEVPAVRSWLKSTFPTLQAKIFGTEEHGNEWSFLELVASSYSGSTIVRLDKSVILQATFTFWLAQNSNNKKIHFTYFDHDYLSDNNERVKPHFKQHFNYDLCLNHNYCGPVWAVSRAELLYLLRKGESCCSDINLEILLCFVDFVGSDLITHIAKIGFSCSSSESPELDKNAIERHLVRIKTNAQVLNSRMVPNCARIAYAISKPEPLISIIIPTRDRLDLLEKCIQSIDTRSSYRNYEIIVVDNGSTEINTLRYFEAIGTSKNTRIIRLDEQFNYSKLNNLGVTISKGEILCFMNNDIEVISQNWMQELAQFACQESVGVVGAKLYYPNDTIQHAGVILGATGNTGHLHRHNDRSDFGYMHLAGLQQSVSAVTGAVMMISRNKFDAISAFDENLAVNFNDIDLCLKASNAGYRNIFNPYAELYHFESLSRGLNNTSSKKLLAMTEARYLLTKHRDRLNVEKFYNPNLSEWSENFELAFPPSNLWLDSH